MRLILFVLVAALALAASAAAASPVRATMSTSSTQPLADTPWRYTIVVKDRAGNPLAARVRLQLLRGARVVALLEVDGDGAVLRSTGGNVDLVQGKADGGDRVAGEVGGGQAHLPGHRGRGDASARAPRAHDRSSALS